MSNEKELSDAEQRLKELDDELGEIMDEYASLMATVRGSSDDPKTDARLNVAMELLNQAAGSNVELFGVLEALKEDAHQSDKKRRVTKKLQQMRGSDMR